MFHVDTPFARVAKSCRTMGEMISDIATGVKEMAILRIPLYEGTQGVGYRSLDKTDFENATNNTKMVISTLGGAIMSLYKGPVHDIYGNKIADSGSEMFGWQLIGDNPFASTVKSTRMLGKLISDIASGVKNVAQLNIAEYDAQGNITGYRPMNDDDFASAAKNTEIILTTLAGAIIQTYEHNPEMFTDPSMWHTDADKTPFGMAVKSLAGVGNLISSAVKGIQDIAKLEVDFAPLEGKNGKIARIITVLAEGIMEAYKEHEEWFTDDSFWHTDPKKTPFGMVMQSMNGITKFIETVAKAIDDINKLEFAAQDVAIGGEVYNKVQRIVSVVPKAVIDLMRDKVYGKYLMDDDYIETYEDINSMYSYFVKIINNGVKAYELVAKMDIPESANVEERVLTILQTIPKAIIDEYIRNSQYYTSENKVFKVMEDSFERYKSLVSYIVDTYKNTFNRLNDIGAVTDESIIANVSSRINKMITDMGSSVNLMTSSLNLDNVKLFSETVSIYKDGLRSLIKAISMVPEDLKEYDNVLNAISSINIKVAEIPALTNFRDEQEILSDYIQTLNSLDVTNVNALTELMSTMNQLSANLGSLDKFTDTLANRVAEVLANLTQQIQVSGNIITKAEELQERRHRAINDSISKLREFMEKPLAINVTHTEGQVSNIDLSGSVADYGPSASSYPAATAPQPAQVSGGIDYTKLRNTIVGAILATRQDNSQFNNSRYN